jgi:hypothetical protein
VRNSVPAMTLVVLAWVTACQQQRQQAAGQPAGRVTVDSVYLTSNSGIQKRERTVVTDSVSWARMWTRLTADHVIPLPLPEIEFDSNVVVVASAGTTAAGHSVRIDSVTSSTMGMKVHVRDIIYDLCGPSDLEVRYPAHAVRVRRPAGPLHFVEDSTVRRCRN